MGDERADAWSDMALNPKKKRLKTSAKWAQAAAKRLSLRVFRPTDRRALIAHSPFRPFAIIPAGALLYLSPFTSSPCASSRNLVISSGKGGKTPNSVTKPVTKRRGVTSKA
jgi:hypothetical protein